MQFNLEQELSKDCFKCDCYNSIFINGNIFDFHWNFEYIFSDRDDNQISKHRKEQGDRKFETQNVYV